MATPSLVWMLEAALSVFQVALAVARCSTRCCCCCFCVTTLAGCCFYCLDAGQQNSRTKDPGEKERGGGKKKKPHIPDDAVGSLAQLLGDIIALIDDKVLVKHLEDLPSLKICHVARHFALACTYLGRQGKARRKGRTGAPDKTIHKPAGDKAGRLLAVLAEPEMQKPEAKGSKRTSSDSSSVEGGRFN